MRILLGRLALVLAGCLLGVLALEGLLQIGALAVRRSGRELPVAWLTGHRRILCLGDSNTYGLWLERDEAYPKQLEALWNERVGRPRVEALNLGFPGTNSSRLRRDFPRMLATFRPDVAIVWVGVNDYWTLPVELGSGSEAGPSRSFLERHSLVFKLAYMLRRASETAQLEVRFDSPDAPGAAAHLPQDLASRRRFAPGEGHSGTARFGAEEFELGFAVAGRGELYKSGQKLRDNLLALAAEAGDAGVRFLLLTYPSRRPAFAEATRFIRLAAQASGTELVDAAALFEPLCPADACPEYLFPDQHPRANGYRLIAEAVFEQLRGP